jgi:hypothetical protein
METGGYPSESRVNTKPYSRQVVASLLRTRWTRGTQDVRALSAEG